MEDKDIYTKEIVDYEVSCRPTLPVITDPKEVKLGDHLHWREIGSWRDGIVTDIDITYNGPAVVSLVRYSHVFGSGMLVQQENRQIDFAKCKVQRYDYEEHCHPPNFVIARARACIGQKGYNALRNNNDDFCRWCKSGKHTYLCINETVLNTDIELDVDKDDMEKESSTTYIPNINNLNPGDHLAWKSLHTNRTGKDDDGWRHGIVIDMESISAEIIGFDDKTNSISTLVFKTDEVDEYKFRRIIYRKSHMLDEVIDRAKYLEGSQQYVASESKYFAAWCKTAMPQDSDAVETVLIEPKITEEKEEKDEVPVGKEIGKLGARTSAITVARVGEGAAATAVKTGVKQGSKILVRGAAEGAAAAAAVGVEAVFLAVDVGLTYKSFNRKQISKDELQKRHIQNTVRAAGAAGAGVAGGAAGAAIGTVVFPGIGTIVGGIIGGIVGGISGQVGGHFAGKGIAFAAGRPYEKLFVEDYTEQN